MISSSGFVSLAALTGYVVHRLKCTAPLFLFRLGMSTGTFRLTPVIACHASSTDPAFLAYLHPRRFASSPAAPRLFMFPPSIPHPPHPPSSDALSNFWDRRLTAKRLKHAKRERTPPPPPTSSTSPGVCRCTAWTETPTTQGQDRGCCKGVASSRGSYTGTPWEMPSGTISRRASRGR